MRKGEFDRRLNEKAAYVSNNNIINNAGVVILQAASTLQQNVSSIPFEDITVSSGIQGGEIKIMHKNKTLFYATKVKPSETHFVANEYHVTEFRDGGWIEDLKRAASRVGDLLKVYQKEFGVQGVSEDDAYMGLFLKKEEIAEKVREKNLVGKCVNFALIGDCEILNRRSHSTHSKAQYTLGDIFVEHENGKRYYGNGKHIRVEDRKEQKVVFYAEDEPTRSNFINLKHDDWCLGTYHPGSWEEVISSAVEEISAKEVDNAKEKLEI